MIQAIVVKGATSVRATVIANRTKSEEMGVMKALMIENLKTKLQNGINLAKAKTNGNGESRENYCTTAFYDVEKGAWRSFRWESLVEVF